MRIPRENLDHTMPIRVSNIENGQTVHQRLLLVNGRTSKSNQFERCMTVSSSDYPTTFWPCVDTHFKVLVHLVPGSNTVTLALEDDPSSATQLIVNYIPLLQNPPLHLCIFVARDSPCKFDVPPEKRGQDTLDVAVEKMRVAGYMWQAFCAEQMQRNGLGWRTFRLDEAWLPDTLSFQDGKRQRHTAQVHIVRSKYSVAEIRDPRRAQQNPKRNDNVPSLHAMFMEDIQRHPLFQHPCIVAGLILDTHWDGKLVLGHAALGGGSGEHRLGIFGSHSLHSWPRNLEEIPLCMMDNTPTDTRYVANDANESGEWWRALNIGMGAMLHEAGHALWLTHTPHGIMSRGYNNWNRTFMAKEPPGGFAIDPSNEGGSKWHRLDIARLRYNPAFRLPSDRYQGPESDDGSAPLIMPLNQHTLHVSAPKCGLAAIELNVNDRYRTHLEFLDTPSSELPLNVHHLKQQAGCTVNDRLTMQVVAANLRSSDCIDIDQFMREHVVHFPAEFPSVPVLKSDGYGHGGLGASLKSSVLFPPHQRKRGRITCIRVHHGSFLDGLVFRWDDGTEDVLGKGGGGSTNFPLYPDEMVIGFNIRSGAWVDGIQFLTSKGRTSPWFGGRGGSLYFVQPPVGYRLAGMYSTAGQWMDSIGIYYVRQ